MSAVIFCPIRRKSFQPLTFCRGRPVVERPEPPLPRCTEPSSGAGMDAVGCCEPFMLPAVAARMLSCGRGERCGQPGTVLAQRRVKQRGRVGEDVSAPDFWRVGGRRDDRRLGGRSATLEGLWNMEQ
jgi:hypothetical protein